MNDFIQTLDHGIGFALLAFGLMLAAAYSAGWLLSDSILQWRWRVPLAKVVVETTIGFNLLALAALMLGTLGWLTAPVL